MANTIPLLSMIFCHICVHPSPGLSHWEDCVHSGLLSIFFALVWIRISPGFLSPLTVCQVAASLFTDTSVISVVSMFFPLQKVPPWGLFCSRLWMCKHRHFSWRVIYIKSHFSSKNDPWLQEVLSTPETALAECHLSLLILFIKLMCWCGDMSSNLALWINGPGVRWWWIYRPVI